MSVTRPVPLPPSASASAKAEASSALLAKAALKRLAMERLEPTPENYERAYRHEAGDDADDGEALATLIERIVRGLDRGCRHWTPARKKEGLQRVLAGRGDSRRLQQRLRQLLDAWESDSPGIPVALIDGATGPVPLERAASPAPASARDEALAAHEAFLEGIRLDARPSGFASAPPPAASPAAAPALEATSPAPPLEWNRVARSFAQALKLALPVGDGGHGALADELVALSSRIDADGATAELAAKAEALAGRAERVLQHRHHLFEQLGKLCRELTASLADLAEDGSWVKGQCEAMQLKIDEGLSARGVRAVGDMLRQARKQHATVRGEREQARDALKSLIAQMLAELAELGSKTGNFSDNVGRYAEVIEQSDSLESLTGVVREMVVESRNVHAVVQQTQDRLQQEHGKASDLSDRVNKLEDEMRRLSDEVSTDQLTQIANRRGLVQAFEVELAKLRRDGGEMAIGLLDIDNFKRLNDELGHIAGDEALKSLAAVISRTLRPGDRIARYGGEEFVVLLPQTSVGDGQTILTRLQRSLTGGLFMHKDEHVFVTFSAGVTDYRLEERIEDSLERADQALYEAKRTGKNRTCIG